MPSRSIRQGQLEFELAFVEGLAINRHAYHADYHDAAFRAAHLGSEVDGLVLFRGGGDDHSISTMAAGEPSHRLRKSVAYGHVGAKLLR